MVRAERIGNKYIFCLFLENIRIIYQRQYSVSYRNQKIFKYKKYNVWRWNIGVDTSKEKILKMIDSEKYCEGKVKSVLQTGTVKKFVKK